MADIRAKYAPDWVIANGENSAGGLGISPDTAEELFSYGIEFITSGNHVWSKREVIPYLEKNAKRIIRPLNYPPGAPGEGWAVIEKPGLPRLAVFNLLGRVFMDDLVDCPFRAIGALLDSGDVKAELSLVDFHAEATSEKIAMGYFLDGRVGALVGTHTHVQTADERILPKGTAYISDAGMCGPLESVIGVKQELVVERFVSGLPTKFPVAGGVSVVNGVSIDFGEDLKAVGIGRIALSVGSQGSKDEGAE